MISDCIDAAVRQGHITKDEGELLKKRFDAIAKQVLSPVEAKAQLVREIEITTRLVFVRRRALGMEAR